MVSNKKPQEEKKNYRVLKKYNTFAQSLFESQKEAVIEAENDARLRLEEFMVLRQEIYAELQQIH